MAKSNVVPIKFYKCASMKCRYLVKWMLWNSKQCHSHFLHFLDFLKWTDSLSSCKHPSVLVQGPSSGSDWSFDQSEWCSYRQPKWWKESLSDASKPGDATAEVLPSSLFVPLCRTGPRRHRHRRTRFNVWKDGSAGHDSLFFIPEQK